MRVSTEWLNTIISFAIAGKSDVGHGHAAEDITSGVLPVSRGGTGGATPQKAVENLFPNHNQNPGWFAVFDNDFETPGHVATGSVRGLIGAVDNNDPRLTDAREPTAHYHDDRYEVF